MNKRGEWWRLNRGGQQLLTLEEWAEVHRLPMCKVTLQRWARSGKISPLPEKYGRAYLVQPTARYVSGKAPRLRDRIRRVA